MHRRRRSTCLGCPSGGVVVDGGGLLLWGFSGLKPELLACFRACLGRQPCHTAESVSAGKQRGRDNDGNKTLTVGGRRVANQCMKCRCLQWVPCCGCVLSLSSLLLAFGDLLFYQRFRARLRTIYCTFFFVHCPYNGCFDSWLFALDLSRRQGPKLYSHQHPSSKRD